MKVGRSQVSNIDGSNVADPNGCLEGREQRRDFLSVAARLFNDSRREDLQGFISPVVRKETVPGSENRRQFLSMDNFFVSFTKCHFIAC